MSYEQKAIVKIDSDGAVAKCAKGLAGGECGYKAGSKVCGKCGAMAVEVKMVPVNEVAELPEDEMSEEEYKKMLMMRRAKKEMGMSMDVDMEDEEDSAVSDYLEPMKKGGMRMRMPMMDEEMDEEMYANGKGGMRMRMPMPEADGDMMDEEEDMEPMATPKGMRWGKRMMSYKEEDEEMMEGDEDEEMMEDEEDEDEMGDVMPMRPAASGMTPDLEAARLKRLRSLGTKSADIGLNGFMCAIERKVYPGSISVCDDCPGGCVAEKGLPGLLHVEGLAETMFKGDVIDSGYSSEADMFVVDVQTKSGYVNEVFIDGTTAEVLGFHRLDDSIFEQKSLMDDIELIDFNEAAEIAVKSVPGTVMAVEPSVFEGFDAYQVEVDGFDSKSYDVYVALDGEVLGWDKWEPDDVDEIEAEAAEISLKRAFSEETRQQMAESGEAMEDGSFPISGEADLRNAIMAHGRAKDIPAAKRHIMKRAMELGMEKLIPAEWAAGEKSISVDGDSEGEFLKSLVEFELLQTEVGDDK
jgi:uncharacterized membrane protein YkoI